LKRAILSAVLGAIAVVALMAARPGNEFQLLTQLNGQPTRWTLPDGGRSGVFTVFDAGAANATACVTLRNGRVATGRLADAGFAFNDYVPQVLLMVPSTPVVVCVRPGAASTYWDGGCSQSLADENYGVPIQPFQPWYVVPEQQATTLCASSDAGYVQLPIWGVQ